MGPKGERGHPGSIVWNGIKVGSRFDVLFDWLNMHLGRKGRAGTRAGVGPRRYLAVIASEAHARTTRPTWTQRRRGTRWTSWRG